MFEWLKRETHPVFIYGKTVTPTTEMKKTRSALVIRRDFQYRYIAELEKDSLLPQENRNAISGPSRSIGSYFFSQIKYATSN